MITVRKSKERGHFDHGWLDTYHSFSFADYYDPRQMGFRALRVINEDRVNAGGGFGMHPHRDMEIITYIVDGELAHRDSMGTGSVIRPGDIQRMSAGTGVRHSEFNYSETQPVHLLQIWLLPERSGLRPEYAQKTFPASEKRGRFRLVASHDGRDGSVTIHQDANLYATILSRGEKTQQPIGAGRYGWLQVVKGELLVNGTRVSAGDGAAITSEDVVRVEALQDSEALLFDLA